MRWSVSVVIIALGEAPGLGDTLASVAAQTHRAAEVILVSDRVQRPPTSTSPCPTLLLATPGDITTSAARNAGFHAARHDHVLFLDAGDVLTPVALAAGLACAERNPESAFVHGAHRHVDAEGRAIGPRRRSETGDDAYVALLEGWLIDCHAAVLYRRDLLEESGGFRPELSPPFSAYDLQLRLARDHAVGAHGTEAARQLRPRLSVCGARSRLAAALRVHRAHRPSDQDPERWRQAWHAGERRLRDRFAREVLIDRDSGGRPRLHAVLGAATLSPWLITLKVGRLALAKAAQLLPMPVGNTVARRQPELRSLGIGRVRLGDLDRTEPVSRDFGFDRGLPVDRYYIERFLEGARPDICGRVLEVGDAAYSSRYGGSRIQRQDVLHVHAGNPAATIVGDISRAQTLPRSAFDCIVFTQTLHLVYDMRAAVEELHAALKPGGVLLLTVPGISQIDRGEWGDHWYWALTPAAVRRLLGEAFRDEAITVASRGNVYAATVFLQGLALTEVDPGKLDVQDEAYPVIVTAHATKWPGDLSNDVGEGPLGASEVGESPDEQRRR